MKSTSTPARNQLNFETFQSETSDFLRSPIEKKSDADGRWSTEEELLSLAEKLQSEKLPPLDAAKGYWRLMQTPYLLSPQQIAKALGQETSFVQQALSLLTLPESVQNLLEHHDLSLDHIVVLRRLRRDDDLALMARRAHDQQWNVQTTEQHVQIFLGEIEKIEEETMRSQLEKLLGTPLGEKSIAQGESDPLLPVWAKLQNQRSLQALGDWRVQYKGALRWEFNVKPATGDAGASRLRLAEWFRAMAAWLEGSAH